MSTSATMLMLNLAGGVALLLWSMRMVRTGILRAYGASLRRLIGTSGINRFTAFLSGIGITALLQSSTATSLMAASFVGRGLIPVGVALAVVLGADVGTSLVVQALSLRIEWLSPVLLTGGVITFLSARTTRPRDLGRVAVGLGLLLLSVQLIVGASAPMRDSELLRDVVAGIGNEPVPALLAGALLAWVAHSSLAIVLLAMSLAATGVLPLPFALAVVLGANLGGALPALALSTAEPPTARRVPLGNLLFRALGVALVLPFLPIVLPWLAELESAPARQVANFHTGFNLLLAALFLGLTGPAARLCARLMPETPRADEPGRPRYLDQAAVDTPSLALAAAAREALRMGDVVADMLGKSLEVFRNDDRKLMREVEDTDDVVDRLHEAIKLYLAETSRETLTEAESRRCLEIASFTTNLEHIGDIVDKNLMELAGKKIKNQLSFSPDGFAEIETLHRRAAENLQIALGVFLTGDVKAARRLVGEKVEIRNLERSAAENHLDRLRAGRIESLESSSLHLDVLRDLRRIHSHIAAIGYPILEAAGELRPSRLADATRPSADDEPRPLPGSLPRVG